MIAAHRATRDYEGALEKRYQDCHAEINGRGPRHITRPSGWLLVRDDSPEPLLVEQHVMYIEAWILSRLVNDHIRRDSLDYFFTYSGMTFRSMETGEEVTIPKHLYCLVRMGAGKWHVLSPTGAGACGKLPDSGGWRGQQWMTTLPATTVCPACREAAGG